MAHYSGNPLHPALKDARLMPVTKGADMTAYLEVWMVVEELLCLFWLAGQGAHLVATLQMAHRNLLNRALGAERSLLL